MSILQIDRRSIANFNWFLLASVLILNLIGIINLSSAAIGTGLWKTQIYWLLLGLLVAFVTIAIDYKRYQRFANLIYGASLLVLLGVHLFGHEVSGSQSWYDFGFIHLQPSEPMKIALIIIIARIYSRDTEIRPWGFRELIWPSLLGAVPIVSILLEPDMGTALVFILLFGSMILIAGVRRYIILTAVVVITLIVVSYPVWKKALKPHQVKRIETFINPEEADPKREGYNVLQAKIAVGSGGFWGKGYKKGSTHMLRFLPEQQTDFVFGVWAEEMGFIRVLPLLALYLYVVVSGIFIAEDAKDRFGAMLAIGCTSLLFWHIFINIAMVVGLVPVIGVPLPFMSYGGSNLMTFMIAVGLILNVGMRKYFF